MAKRAKKKADGKPPRMSAGQLLDLGAVVLRQMTTDLDPEAIKHLAQHRGLAAAMLRRALKGKRPTPGKEDPHFWLRQFAATFVSVLPELEADEAQQLIERPMEMTALLLTELKSWRMLHTDHRYGAKFTVEMIDSVAILNQTEAFRRLLPGAGNRQAEEKMVVWQKQVLHELRCADSRTITRSFQPHMQWSQYLPWTSAEAYLRADARGLELATPQVLIAYCERATTEPPQKSRLVSLVPIRILGRDYYLVRAKAEYREAIWDLLEDRGEPWRPSDQILLVDPKSC